MELDEQALNSNGLRKGYRQPPVHQDLCRTICFALPPGLAASAIAEVLAGNGATVKVVDEFRYKEGEAEHRAITYELSYPNPTGELSADEVNQRLQELISSISNRYSEQGVVHR